MMKSCWSLLLICVVFGIFVNSHNASAQSLKAVPKGTTSAALGYYEYLPQGYSPTDSKKWPLIIFLHGVGEVGDGTSQLSIILRTGLPLLLQKGKSLPFVIIMPQANQQWWDPGQVDQMYEFVKTKYNIDQNRFYMTGLSLGGIGTWLYTLAYPQKVAAMVSCSGNSGGHTDICGMNNIPIWDFHGDADPTVDILGDITAITTINTVCKVSPKAKLTVYPGVTHNCWDRTYDGTGMGTESKSYDPFNMDIYTWFLQYSKNGTTTPVNITANAGANKTITLPTNSVTLSGSGSSSAGSVSYAWTKTSGGSATLSNQNTATLTVSGLAQGSYTFQLKITDTAGNTATSLVSVTVNAASVVTANGGGDKTITLPANSVTLYGSGSSTAGSVSYAWTKTSGGSAALSNQNTSTLTASGLAQGSYTFQLKVTDAGGNSATSNVGVTVNAAVAVSIKANAGSNQTITLPANSVTLYGSGTSTAGSIASYLWTKASGSSASFTGQNTATLNVTGLLQGSYVFQLKITDTAGNTATSLVGVTVNPAVVVTPPPTGNLVAEWSLDGNTNDISGNNINGTPMGLTYSSDHAQGSSSGVFNGSNQYVNINSSALPAGKSARSISLWAKPNSVSETVFRWAFAYGSAKTSSAMLIGQNGPTLYGGGFGDDLKAGSFWKANTWHHICLTYDGTTARLYGNGKLLASGAKNWNLVLAAAAIGRQVSGLEYWNGSVDDVRLYNKALSDAEVASLAAGGTSTSTSTASTSSSSLSSGLVAEWRLDYNVNDATANAINGTAMNGATTYDTQPKEGTAALKLNGANQYVDFKNPSQLPSGKSPRTMSLWAKTNDISDNYRWAAAYGSPYASQAMFIGQNGKKLYGGGFVDDITYDNFWEVGVWHHLCLTYDGTTARLYADGKYLTSAAKNWNLILSRAYIGRQVVDAEYWNGSVDDVRIYNRALSDAEVLALATSSTTTSSSSAALSVNSSDALVGEWSFDNNTVDKTGHSPNGSLMAGAWYDSGFKEGSASLLLNGASQYVDLKNPSILPSGKTPRTMSLWAKTKDMSDSYRWCAAYGKAAQSQAMFIGQKGTALYGGGFTDDLIVNNFWTFDTWHHIVLTYDGATAFLYADGKLVSSAAKNWNLVLENAYVGRQVNNAEYWNGSVDDVRFYAKTLTTAEVQSLYQSTGGTNVRSATVEDPSSVSTTPQPEEGASNFVIYPNPAQHNISLNIESDAVTENGSATIIIHDMSGKQVKRIDGLTHDSMPTDIDELTDGIYVATIVVQGKTVSRQRFVKANR